MPAEVHSPYAAALPIPGAAETDASDVADRARPRRVWLHGGTAGAWAERRRLRPGATPQRARHVKRLCCCTPRPGPLASLDASTHASPSHPQQAQHSNNGGASAEPAWRSRSRSSSLPCPSPSHKPQPAHHDGSSPRSPPPASCFPTATLPRPSPPLPPAARASRRQQPQVATACVLLFNSNSLLAPPPLYHLQPAHLDGSSPRSPPAPGGVDGQAQPGEVFPMSPDAEGGLATLQVCALYVRVCMRGGGERGDESARLVCTEGPRPALPAPLKHCLPASAPVPLCLQACPFSSPDVGRSASIK